MNAISGPAQPVAIGSLMTTSSVRPVRRVLANDQRVPARLADRWEPSGERDAGLAPTYGRDGRTAGARRAS